MTTFVTPNQISQAIDFAALGNKTITDNPFTVQAFASSDLTVTFASLTSSVCTVNGTLVMLTGLTGSCTLRASQAGNLFYFAAPAVERTFQVINPKSERSHRPSVLRRRAASSTAIATLRSLPLPRQACQSWWSVSQQGFVLSMALLSQSSARDRACSMRHKLATATSCRLTCRATVTIAKAQQTITFAALADKVFGDPDFTISASATSGGAVSFATQTPAICTVNDTLVSLVAAGSCTIRLLRKLAQQITMPRLQSIAALLSIRPAVRAGKPNHQLCCIE